MSAFSYAASSGSLMNILGSSPTPAGYSTGGSTLPAIGGATGTSWTSGEALMMGGSIMSIFGAVNSAIGSFYAADSQKTQLKMQAQNQRFQAQMSAINARGAEMQAQAQARERKQQFQTGLSDFFKKPDRTYEDLEQLLPFADKQQFDALT